jgi:hypothetical protein
LDIYLRHFDWWNIHLDTHIAMSGFFESIRGNKSSTRLIGFVVIIIALVFSQEVLWFGREDIVQAAIAAGTIFITIAGPAMFFMFEQKKTEVKQEDDEKD